MTQYTFSLENRLFVTAEELRKWADKAEEFVKSGESEDKEICCINNDGYTVTIYFDAYGSLMKGQKCS